MGIVAPCSKYCLRLSAGIRKNNHMSLSIKYLTSIQKAADLNINPLAYRKLAQQQIHYALGP
jgi:hypothetical protein